MLHAHVCLACACAVYTCAYVRMYVCIQFAMVYMFLLDSSSLPPPPLPPLLSPLHLPSPLFPPSPPLPSSPGGTPLLPVVPHQRAHCQQLTTALRGLVEGTAQSTGVHCSLVLSLPLSLHAFVCLCCLRRVLCCPSPPSPLSKGQHTLLIFP